LWKIKVYTEDDNLLIANNEIKEVYKKFKTAILNYFDNVDIKPTKNYIAFIKNKSNITDFEIQKLL
jgi:hypothetical protein